MKSSITEYEVIFRNDRSLAPVRLISEELGADVGWDGGKREVSIKKGQDEIVLAIGKDKAYVNGRAIALDCPAVLYRDRTYVPLRFIAENLDATVDYAPRMAVPFERYYYGTAMPVSPGNTIVRYYPNIIIGQSPHS
ncbi:MAG: copper amine oxidase N-terminal domain-containing protein [Clostridiales bacterium]|jgi:hypothetical protein|nr:copper amine oxidase N-terminal domain-containing protein [Clostridiales bacterium]